MSCDDCDVRMTRAEIVLSELRSHPELFEVVEDIGRSRSVAEHGA